MKDQKLLKFAGLSFSLSEKPNFITLSGKIVSQATIKEATNTGPCDIDLVRN